MATTTTETSQYPLRLPTDTYETLRAEADASGISINSLLNRIVDEHIASNRETLIAQIGAQASERYAIALDKLRDL